MQRHPAGRRVGWRTSTPGRRRASFGIVALLLLSAAAAWAQESASVVLPAVQVNREIVPNRSHYGQQLLVDPRDAQTLVIVDNDLATSAGACPVYVSRDAGRSWATRRSEPKMPGYGSCTRPTFGPSMDAEFASDGTLYVLAAGSETASGRGTTDVYLARSTDLGESWQFTTIVKGTDEIDFTKPDGSKAKDTVRYNRLRMAVHPRDPRRVYAGIMSSPANLSTNDHPLRANVAVSTDGGRTFGPLVDIFQDVPPDQIFGADVPSLAVDSDGAIYAFTKERPPAPPATPTPPTPTPPDTPTATTTTTVAPAPGAGCPPAPARTAPFTPPTTQRPPDTPPVLGKAGAGDRLLFAKSTDGGRSWQGKSIDDEVAICRFCLTTPEAAVDPDNGNVYVVFEASLTPPPTPRDDRNIYFMASTDGGQTFTQKSQLNDDVDPNRRPNYNQLFPGISVAPNGRIDVAWYDFRTDGIFNPDGRGFSDLSGEVCWDVFYTFSTDGGSTWAPNNIRVSDRSMNRDEGISLNPKYDARGPFAVASTDALAHFAWGDSRAGRPAVPLQDVYFTSVMHELPREEDGGAGIRASSVALGMGIGLLIGGVVLFALSRRWSGASRRG
ncbi:MAG: glycoside hydrolase [Actinomycetota bacterium]|nr:glycoside hydrolase [Actinomycetota bacterium]